MAVLLSYFSVSARRLEVAVSKRSNPNIRPGRRDRQRFDLFQRVALCQTRAIRARVSKSLARRPPPCARPGIGDILGRQPRQRFSD